MHEEVAMQQAADHYAKAEELILRGSPQSARLHIEAAKGYVAMAREVRIGRNRMASYHEVGFKPVIVAEQPFPSTDEDDEHERAWVGDYEPAPEVQTPESSPVEP